MYLGYSSTLYFHIRLQFNITNNLHENPRKLLKTPIFFSGPRTPPKEFGPLLLVAVHAGDGRGNGIGAAAGKWPGTPTQCTGNGTAGTRK
jgi:hypothetical protein